MPSVTSASTLPDANELLRVVIDESADYAFIVMDRGGVIQRWNRGAEVLFGFTPEEIVGGHCSILYTIEDVEKGVPEEELRTAATSGKAPDERWHTRRDGTRFFASGVTTALYAGEDLAGFAKLARDATALKHADEERQRLLVREQQLNSEKDAFFAAVSHELRTPLTAMSGWVSLIERDPADARMVRDGIASIKQAAETLAALVDDLLDSVRARTGKMRVNAQPCDLAAVATTAVQAFRQAGQAKQLTVRENLDSPVIVLCDQTRMQQVIWNLVSNAIRHSPAGGQIDIVLRREEQEAVLEVCDRGEGIDPALLPSIFEPFRQHGGAKGGGLGLGLAIARSLVEMHGGRITAHSEGAGRGATFGIRLPLFTASRA